MRQQMLALLLCLSGCAHIDRKDRARITLGYTDRDHLVAVQLRDALAEPRGPSSGGHTLAARLGGNVCGTDIAFDASYLGRAMSLTGFATDIHSRGDQMSLVFTNTTNGDTEWVG